MKTLRTGGKLQGGSRVGSLSWTYPAVGSYIPERLVGAVEYEVETVGTEGRLQITRAVRADPLGRLVETPGHVIRLEATSPPFGGLRWWFVCPLSGQRVAKLHLPNGAHRFGGQKAYRLGYACQREDRCSQAYRRARRCRRKIGGSANLSERLPRKPKWMRWRTYERHKWFCILAEERTTAHLAAGLQRLRGAGLLQKQ